MPFTDREDVELVGLRPQASRVNFLHELLNIRFRETMVALGLDPLVDAPPAGLACDIRQAFHHQNKELAPTMLSGSLCFSYARGRTMAPAELLMQNGWPRDKFSLADFKVVPTNWPNELLGAKTRRRAEADASAAEEPAAKRRRKGQMPMPHTAATDLAGNGQVLPDLAGLTLPLWLGLQGAGLWPNEFLDAVLDALLAEYIHINNNIIVTMDPFTEDARTIRKLLGEQEGSRDIDG